MPISCHFRDCKALAGCESDSCKQRCQRYSKLSDLYLYLYSKISLNFNQDMKGDSEILQVYICLLVAVVKQWVIVDHSNKLGQQQFVVDCSNS